MIPKFNRVLFEFLKLINLNSFDVYIIIKEFDLKYSLVGAIQFT